MHPFDFIFNPSSIAVIGATDKKEKVGYGIFKNIISGGYKGKVFPVNKRLETLEGYKVYKSVLDIPDKVDLAIISIPIKYVPELFDELGKKGVKGAVVISAGGKEAGEEGRKIEQILKEKGKKYGIRFLGPNCLGFANTEIDLNANFGLDRPLKGKTAFISQSGALFTAIMDWALEEKIGFSYAVSIGNMADIEFGELIEYLGEKENVDTILVYMESLTDAEKFAKASRKISRYKPIIVAKSGKSKAGQKAATSHTGAISGKDFLYSALFKRTGAVRCDNVLQLFDLTEAFSKQPVPEGDRFAVVTNAGGPGVMAADEFERWNISPAQLSKDTVEKLNTFLPPVWSRGNPIDIIGDAPPERYRKTLEVLFEAKEIDGIICILTPQFMTKPYETAEVFINVSKGRKKPFYTVLLGGEKLKKAKEILEENNIPVFETPEEAVDSMYLSYTYTYRKKLLERDILKQVEDRDAYNSVNDIISNFLSKKQFLLPSYETKKILSLYNIPVNETYLAKSLDEAIFYGEKLGFPVVLKVNSPDILHKTEAKGVIKNITSVKQLTSAYSQILENARKYKKDAYIEGIVVEKQVDGDFELIVGSSFDNIFKQYVMFGMGGTFVEFFKDVSFDFIPLSQTFAYEMVKSTKIYKLLKEGFRDKKPVNIEKIVNLLINVSKLLTDFPYIKELDINPILVKENSIFAVDGRIKLSPSREKNTILL